MCRVIHRRNNLVLEVFNGDIGFIREIDNEDLTCEPSRYSHLLSLQMAGGFLPAICFSCALEGRVQLESSPMHVRQK